MKKERFTLRAAVYLLLFQNGKVLLIRRFNTGWQDGKYSLVAGHVDGGETIYEAMAREAKEEAGIVIQPADLRVVHVMHRRSDREYIDFFLTTDIWDGDPFIAEKDKVDDMVWVPIETLTEDVLPYIRNAVGFHKQKIFFSENGF